LRMVAGRSLACRARRLIKNASGGADEGVIGRHHHVDRTGPMNPA
jgi:hypothetical protein